MAQSGTEERKTSTILAMDVARYSQLMGIDEEGTLKQLKACREIIETNVSEAKGRIFNTAGDAFMVEFSNTLSAVNAAIAIQKQISEHNQKIPDASKRLYFRMGINLGDVMVDGDNLLGDGVNVAARLEGIAPPGGICISEIVHTTVQGKLECGFINKGEQNLKNITYSVKAYYLDIKTGEIDPKKFKAPTAKSKTGMYIGGLVVASIAAILLIVNPFKEQTEELNKIVILPLETNSQVQDQINLAVGLTQDISGALTSSSKQLNIINVNQVPENLAELHRDTKASYLIKGSLRFLGDNLRVSINLIDAKTLSNIWSDNYDRKFKIDTIFQIQDEIVNNIVDELVGNGAVLSKDIAKNISTKGTTNLSAYECVNFVRGQFFKVLSPDLHMQSLECLKKSVADDPDYKEAWQLLSQLYTWGVAIYGYLPKEETFKAAEIAVDNALRIDKDFARAYASKAELYTVTKRHNAAFEYGEKAVKLAPNDAAAVGMISYLNTLLGGGCNSPEEIIQKYNINKSNACKMMERGYELAKISHKLDLGNIYSYDNYGLGFYYAEKKDWEKVIEVFEKIPNPTFVPWLNSMAIAYDAIGDEQKASELFGKLKSVTGENKAISTLNFIYSTWGNNIVLFEEHSSIYKKYGLN